MIDGTSAKQLNLSEVSTTVSSSVTSTGWTRYSVGKSSEIDYNYRFDLYIRRRKLSDLVSQNDDIFKKSSNVLEITSCENTSKINGLPTLSSMVSKDPMGNPQKDLTPSTILPVTRGSEKLPMLSSFSNYPSLASARTDSPALVIAFDSEWYYMVDNGQSCRNILSWQFSLIEGEDLVEFIFIRKNEKYGLSLELAVGRILDSLAIEPTDIRQIRKYESITGTNEATGGFETTLFATKDEALKNSIQLFPDGKKVRIKYDWSNTPHIPVVLLCHAGKVDVSGFDQRKKYSKDILKFCSEVQGGLISLQPTKVYAQSVNPNFARNRNTHTYPISLQLADTMCHAPAGMKSLKALGKTVGWEKIQLNEGDIEHMDRLLMNDPCSYFEYAANDSNVTLLYESALYGYHSGCARQHYCFETEI